MRRREFLTAGMAFAQLVAMRPLFAQNGGMITRAAVVIGVDKINTAVAPEFAALKAAASGARKVATWLEGEGFAVKTFTDETNPVKTGDIFAAISGFIEKGTLTQLVVYFSGHGVNIGYNELWLLSDAPYNPGQAISLDECAKLAERNGITNVVFISDACRSLPTSIGAALVRGTPVFPPGAGSSLASPATKVDRFFATRLGDPAYEISADASVKSYQGVYTASFLSAFQAADPIYVRDVNGLRVVPNRKLEHYLLHDVPRRAQRASIKLVQYPDSKVLSSDDTYIGRALSETSGSSSNVIPTTAREVAYFEFKQSNLDILKFSGQSNLEDIELLASEIGFKQAQSRILQAKRPQSFETGSGLSINGISLRRVLARGGVTAEMLGEGNEEDRPVLVQLDFERPIPSSVVLEFSDGSGTVIAGLAGYIGTVVVEKGNVVTVNYIRSGTASNTEERLTKLRARVATAARYGVFRIEGGVAGRAKRAANLANQIRVLKSIDPTLGLYASYAYADANMIDQVRSVHSYMETDLSGALFDVAMLAGYLSNKPVLEMRGVAPFCPMLSQGWQLLRVMGVTMPAELDRARDHLRPSLWTTFAPEGMKIIIEAVMEGKL